MNEIEAAIREQRLIKCDVRLVRGLGGDYVPFHLVGRAVLKKGDTYSFYAAYTPISDEAMSIQEMLPIALTAVMSASSELSFVKDRSLRYICCSRAFARMLGKENEAQVVGKSDFDLFDRAYAAKYFDDDIAIMESGGSIVDKIERIPSEDGKERYSSTSKYLLYDSFGNVVGIYGTGRDITETQEMRSELELLTNNVPGGIAIYEGTAQDMANMRLRYFSDGFCKLFGFTRQEYETCAARNPLGLVYDEDKPQLVEQIRALVFDNKPMDCIYRAHAKDGGMKWINLKAVMGAPRGDKLTVNAVLFDVTRRQEALEQLRMSEELYRLAMRHSGSVVCRYDVASRTLDITKDLDPAFNLDAINRNIPARDVENGSISSETAEAYTEFYESIIRGEKNGSVIYQRNTANGWRWLEAHFSSIFSDEGKPVYAVISFADVTESFEKEVAYKKWTQSIHDKKPESYSLYRCNVSRRTIIDTSEGSLLQFDLKSGKFDFDGYTAEYAAKYVFDGDRDRFIAFLNVDALLADYYQGKRILSTEYRENVSEGDVRWLKLTVDLVEHPHSADVEAYLLFEDIDEVKRAELMTVERAETDPLTGVMNRTTFAARVNHILNISRPYTQHALMMLDLDGFKQVNDAFGHAAGDQALIDISEALRSVLRKGDLVGRLGGDEFLVFLTDIPNDAVVAVKAKQICAITRKTFSMEVEISGSIGVAITPRNGMDFETLYGKADAALYYVKGSGKNNYAFYHDDMKDEHMEAEWDGKGVNTVEVRDKKRRMLIVDDSMMDHAMLANIFEKDFIIEKAKDGNVALIRLRHFGSAISVVLLDLKMLGMDGFAVLEKMQQSADMRSIPVIVVSSDDDRETSLRAIRMGATDYVTKPVDTDVIKIRVRSAISKAENERLRAKNSLLEYQNNEVIRYRTVLERSGTVVVENDWINGTFAYDPAMNEHIAGSYDDRIFWHILLADLVADTATIKAMQELAHSIATDRQKGEDTMLVQLKTPSKKINWFRMSMYKLTNEFGLTCKLYIAFTDLGPLRPEGEDAGDTGVK